MRRAWIVIGSLTVIFLLGAGNRIWNIRFLYLRSDARADMQTIMRAANAEKGWSASDLALQVVACPLAKFPCMFVFRYQYRSAGLLGSSNLIEAWVENDRVRFEPL